MTKTKTAEECLVEEAERVLESGRGHPIKERLVSLIQQHIGPARCQYCRRPNKDFEHLHAHCAAIAELAAFRGITFEEAREQIREEELVSKVEAKMLGKEHDELVAPAPLFDSDK